MNPSIHQFGLDIFSAAFKKVDSLRIFGTFDPLALVFLPGVAAGAATDEAAIAPEQTHGKSDLAQVAGALPPRTSTGGFKAQFLFEWL